MDTKTETKIVNREGFYGILREDYKAHTGFGIINGQRKDFYYTFTKGTKVNFNRTHIKAAAKNPDREILVNYYNGYDTSAAYVPYRAFDMFRLDIVETVTVQETNTKL